MSHSPARSPADVVFVCTDESCDAGPWESRNDAQAHAMEAGHDHSFTGRPREEVDRRPEPPTIREGDGRPNWGSEDG